MTASACVGDPTTAIGRLNRRAYAHVTANGIAELSREFANRPKWAHEECHAFREENQSVGPLSVFEMRNGNDAHARRA